MGRKLIPKVNKIEYSKIENKPIVLSAFNNDTGFVTIAQVNSAIQSIIGSAPETLNTLQEIAAVVQANDSTMSALTTVVSDKADKSYVDNQLSSKANISSLSAIATSGSYSDLSNKPEIPVVPTNLSSFTNDLGFQTANQINTTLSDYVLTSAENVLQTVRSVVPAASGTTLITIANTTPTISQGAQIWSQTFTPSNATTKVLVNGSFTFATGTASRMLIAFLFRDSVCIGTTGTWGVTTGTAFSPVIINFVDTPATTNQVTYSIRVGVASAATWFINRTATAYFNGTQALSTISLIEFAS